MPDDQAGIARNYVAFHRRVEVLFDGGDGIEGEDRSGGLTLPAKMLDAEAGVAQLVELQPSKLDVASSNLVSRSTSFLGNAARFQFLLNTW